MIAVVGEALIDLVIDATGAVHAAPGGGPYNAARACARLGASVEFLGALSTDRLGNRLAAELAADGVSLSGTPRVDVATTLASAEVAPGGGTRYRFYSEGTSAAVAVAVPAPAPVHVLFTGGLALALEPLASAIETAVVADPAGRQLFVDVNCRPPAVVDRAAYLARLERVLARAHVVKLSDEDLAFAYPGVEPNAAARALLSERTRVVLATFGGDGAIVHTATGETEVASGIVEVVDTIGAGDAFSAGFVTWWTEHAMWRRTGADHHAGAVEATEAAVAVAAAACTRRGADPPRRSELGGCWAPT